MHYTDVRPFAARVVGYAEGKRPVPPQGIRLGADGIELPTRTTWSSGTNDTVELQAHGRAGADGYQARTLTRECVAVVDVDEGGVRSCVSSTRAGYLQHVDVVPSGHPGRLAFHSPRARQARNG